jgi:large conductance mechanosensitive channel
MSEFFEFLRKANALALAVVVIIGTAIGKVVSSLVADVLMPIISFVGGGEWRALQIPLKTASDGRVLTAIAVGNLLGSVVDFVIIACFGWPGSLHREKSAPPGPLMKTCPACAESVLAKATRCEYCSSAV